MTPLEGLLSADQPPTGSDNQITIAFSLDRGGEFTIFARLNCPSAEDDSCWYQINDEEFILRNGLGTSGWQWITLGKHSLQAGNHHINIAYREDGFQLDKLSISTFFLAPNDLGPEAVNLCSE